MQRFNADGSIDSTFGTAGTATVPVPSGYNSFNAGLQNVVVDASGDIIFAADLIEKPSTVDIDPYRPQGSIIVRLTSAGQLDSTFGTGGEFVVPLSLAAFNKVAVQPDGKIVAAGINSVPSPVTAGDATNAQLTVIRLTTAGVLDTTFNGTGELAVLPDSALQYTRSGYLDAIAISASGQIVVAATFVPIASGEIHGVDLSDAELARINGDGSLDSTFGTAGVLEFDAVYESFISDLVIQSDGEIVLLGSGISANPTSNPYNPDYTLIRLLADGTADPSFVADPSLSVSLISRLALDPDGTITGFGAFGFTNSYPALTDQLTVLRFLPNGTADTSFGTKGNLTLIVTVPSASTTAGSYATPNLDSLALTPSGRLLVAGISHTYSGTSTAGTTSNPTVLASQTVLIQLLPIAITKATVAGDYDGDGKSDIAAALEAFGLFAIRPSDGAADIVESFGPAALGGAIPAPGDYDGDGKTDIAAYLPAYGVLAYRPSSGGADVIVPFGIPGAGLSIPAPGDYDGDGKTDVAVYLPTLGDLAYRPSSGGADVIIPFGSAGLGASIPAPGDYDGDGKTDPAVYLPAFGILAYRPSSGGADVLVPFGVAGAGQTIPAPGDYDGDGKTDVAAYFPDLGVFAYRPSGGGADVIESFGIAGAGESIVSPGDYDGDGKTDIAVYLPALGDFAYRPSSGGADVVEQFGAPGTGQTVPAGSILAAQPATASSGTVSAQAVAVVVPLSDDLADLEAGSTHRKKKHASHSA